MSCTHVHNVPFDGLDLVGEPAEVGISKTNLGKERTLKKEKGDKAEREEPKISDWR